MTHFHSRPYTEAGQLNNLAKVFALIRMVDENSVKQIDLHSNDEQLIRIVEQISDVRKIEIKLVPSDLASRCFKASDAFSWLLNANIASTGRGIRDLTRDRHGIEGDASLKLKT
ncbi:MAG: hypothetical protein ACKOGG_00065, partial [Actinomycetota bacterium]